MGNLVDGLGALMLHYPAWRYAIIGGSMLIQGELGVLVMMYFVVNHFVTLGEYAVSSLVALSLTETIVYLIGRLLRGTRFGWKFYRRIKMNRRVQLYSYYLKTNIGKLLVFSKFLPATSVLTLLLTGWSRVKFGKFIRSYLASLILWFVGMSAIAYFLMSGVTYLKTTQAFRGAELAIVLVFLVIIVIQHFAKKFINTRFNLLSRVGVIGKQIEKVAGNAEENSEEPSETKNPAEKHFLRG